ncbi:MAG: hypothetical protein ACE1ZB_04355, partial [Gammaproteobacteria bacterium]
SQGPIQQSNFIRHYVIGQYQHPDWPDLVARVRSIGFSAQTCGLPFVMPKSSAGNNNLEGITGSLNQALSMLDDNYRNDLHLKGFEQVDIGEYQGILDLEISAQEAGYPVLA